jgi:hypothetical protein
MVAKVRFSVTPPLDTDEPSFKRLSSDSSLSGTYDSNRVVVQGAGSLNLKSGHDRSGRCGNSSYPLLLSLKLRGELLLIAPGPVFKRHLASNGDYESRNSCPQRFRGLI